MKGLQMHFTEEEYNVIEHLAACNYTPQRIATMLEVNRKAFAELCFDQSTEVYRRYQKGILQSEFEINQKLLENARKGNITATQQFIKNRNQVKVDNLREKYFGG